MAFQNYIFIFFLLPCLLILYTITRKKYKSILLIVASLIFYAWGEPVYIILLILLTIFNYIMALYMQRKQDRKRKYILVEIIVINLFLLFYFKYYNFFLQELSHILPIPKHNDISSMPLGISFYLFTILSYQFDVYRRHINAESHFITYALYVTWFPKLIMGPIMRYEDFKKQLPLMKIDRKHLESGLTHFIIGLVQKVWIADSLSIVFSQTNASLSSTGMFWLGILAYTLQIYFDFQGYTQMAIGISKIFHIRLCENFHYPYIATSVTDFWRRWHISLSLWFRDYVYIPLGGNRKGICIQIRNLMIVWILTGIWHGANWTFLSWGIYYGCLLIFEKFIWCHVQSKLPVILNWFLTMICIMIGWVFFSSESISQAFQYLQGMFFFKQLPLMNEEFLFILHSCWWILIIAMIWASPLFHYIGRLVSKQKDYVWILKPLGILCLWLLALLYSVGGHVQSFLYFQF